MEIHMMRNVTLSNAMFATILVGAAALVPVSVNAAPESAKAETAQKMMAATTPAKEVEGSKADIAEDKAEAARKADAKEDKADAKEAKADAKEDKADAKQDRAEARMKRHALKAEAAEDKAEAKTK
jgi:hypothetical protein